MILLPSTLILAFKCRLNNVYVSEKLISKTYMKR